MEGVPSYCLVDVYSVASDLGMCLNIRTIQAIPTSCSHEVSIYSYNVIVECRQTALLNGGMREAFLEQVNTFNEVAGRVLP